RIAQSSQSGALDLMRQVTADMHAGAGTELRELAHSLNAMQETLAAAQRGMQGAGEDFSRRLSDAAENLNRLVRDAAGRLADGTEQNRVGLQAIVAMLQDTFERANQKLELDLGSAAAQASAKVEGAMSQVMSAFEARLSGFTSRIEGEISRFA